MTADELVEKVARALYEAWRDGLIMKESTRPWDHLRDEEKTVQRAEARAALCAVHEAMREPSEAMMRAAEREAGAFGAAAGPAIYEAMLAAHPIAEAARDE